MANETVTNAPLLPPEPWYGSAVQLNAVIAGVSQIASIFLRILTRHFEFDFGEEDLKLIFADITQCAAVIFTIVAIVKRQKSTIQPLTLTKKRAESRSETALLNPATMSLKAEGPVALAAGQIAGTQPDTAEIKRQGGFVRPVLLAILLALSVPAALVLPGCALLTPADSQVPAGSFEDRLSNGYNALSSARDVVRILLQGEKIPIYDAENLQKQADNVREGLDIANAMRGTNLESADAKLIATLKLLDALQFYLNKKQNEPVPELPQ